MQVYMVLWYWLAVISCLNLASLHEWIIALFTEQSVMEDVRSRVKTKELEGEREEKNVYGNTTKVSVRKEALKSFARDVLTKDALVLLHMMLDICNDEKYMEDATQGIWYDHRNISSLAFFVSQGRLAR